MRSAFPSFTSSNPYVHEMLMAIEHEQREQLLRRRAVLGLPLHPRRSIRWKLAHHLRAIADRVEPPVAANSTNGRQPVGTTATGEHRPWEHLPNASRPAPE